jgi:two-component system NtrC family sensor kinase
VHRVFGPTFAPAAAAASAAADSPAVDAALTALGRITASVSHELRNGLWALDLALKTLARALQHGAGDARAALAEACAAAARLETIAGNVLALARRRVAPPRATDLRAVCRAALDDIACFVEAAGVRLCVRDDGRPAVGRGEPTLLRQILLNLVLNALAAMSGGGTLRIGLSSRPGWFELTVRDTGSGMDRRTLARATDPFFTTRPGGTGLGLTVVRDVVAALGGVLRLASRPGRGTRVRVRLPVDPRP